MCHRAAAGSAGVADQGQALAQLGDPQQQAGAQVHHRAHGDPGDHPLESGDPTSPPTSVATPATARPVTTPAAAMRTSEGTLDPPAAKAAGLATVQPNPTATKANGR